MFTKEFPSTSDEVWEKIENIVRHSAIAPSWTQIAEELGYTDKKQRKAFHAKRHRKTSDWNRIISILKVLHCELYFIVPETRKDLETMEEKPELIEDREIAITWHKIKKPSDQNLARAVLERLGN